MLLLVLTHYEFQMYTSSNNNGQRLVEFATLKEMVIGGTLFSHKDIHKGTWKAPNGLITNQIDHIIIDKSHKTSLIDVRVCRGANIDSDHYMIMARLRKKYQNTEIVVERK